MDSTVCYSSMPRIIDLTGNYPTVSSLQTTPTAKWMLKDSRSRLLTTVLGPMLESAALMTMSAQRQAGNEIASFYARLLHVTVPDISCCFMIFSFSQQPKMQMEIRQDSVSESNDEARAALERVASTLKQTKTISRRHPGRRE